MASGGKREGAGRKGLSPEEKKVQVSVTIRPETKRKMRELAVRHNVKIGQIVDDIVNNLYREFTDEEV